ncbi:Putative 2-aminoethylphosphonate import ATP-binding protein PhnT [Dyadobacter sp. CECT 9623]|uniref:2-aminoethylphosphonate import ATP-binding protein PhnT n=1 Tax=Dyadobacter linearis TaxID=2823330 RepID=A0ABN7RI16_9BACT|nr:ABC transporter ATP-binding protein [Dyadobacter sp. CECT 9623]CAG5074495.1 Putative 2-aminoethylphosphonate import ATP-binding protein PhnT [Dyadobacter sp. CECT 9623]
MSDIQLSHIDHAYGGQTVLRDFTHTFAGGKITCILGPSGCGKTTVLRLIAGLEAPGNGSIVVNDERVTENGKILVPAYKRRTGFIFQDLALWPHFTVYQNVAFGLNEHHAKNVGQKVKDMLDLFNLSNEQKKYPHQLSGGQKQMVAIARSLVLRPQALLMDEPLANIDIQVKSRILEHLLSIHQADPFTIIYVTHDHKEALDIGNSIVVMNQGNIIASGNSEEIIHSQHIFLKSFIKT